MKVIERVIFPNQEISFLSPIRSKIEYAKVVILGARQLLMNIRDPGNIVITTKMKLIVDRMSRLFFYKDNKYYSVAFPFTVILDDDNVVDITTYSGNKLNNKIISNIIAIVESEQFKLNPSVLDCNIDPDEELICLTILEEILQFEPSYIRYEYDPAHENGKLHPMHHLDINYSQCGTYKLGFTESITKDYFENLQNTKTDCLYLVD